MVQASADRLELLADMLSALAKPVPEYEPESRQTVGPLIFFERADKVIAVEAEDRVSADNETANVLREALVDDAMDELTRDGLTIEDRYDRQPSTEPRGRALPEADQGPAYFNF